MVLRSSVRFRPAPPAFLDNLSCLFVNFRNAYLLSAIWNNSQIIIAARNNDPKLIENQAFAIGPKANIVLTRTLNALLPTFRYP